MHTPQHNRGETKTPSDLSTNVSHTTFEKSSIRGVSGFILRVRTLLFAVWMVLATLVVGLMGLPAIALGAKPAHQVCKFWVRSILFGLRIICGIRANITGRQHLPEGGAVIAANHQSMWETLAIYGMLDKPVMVLKEELLRIPLFGTWLKASGAIAIDRAAGARAMRDLISLAAKQTAQGGQIIIFPEGTRLQPGELEELKPGIAGIYKMAQVPCVPIGHDSGRFWYYPEGIKHHGVVSLHIGQPLAAGMPKTEFMNTLRQRLVDLRPDLVVAPE